MISYSVNPPVAAPYITSSAIVNGELILWFNDGSMINCGPISAVQGAKGERGVSVTKAYLIGGTIMLDFSDGTSDVIGNLIAPNTITPSINSGELVFSYSDGSTVNVGTVVGNSGIKGDKGDRGNDGTGINGIGISNAAIVNGNLTISYTDGSSQSLGSVLGATGNVGLSGQSITGAAGRGITGASLTSGNLNLFYSDGTSNSFGSLVGPSGANGQSGVGLTGLFSNSGNLTAFYTNGFTQNLGNFTGPSGRGITGAALTGNNLVIYYSNNTSQDVGRVVYSGVAGPSGSPGLNATGAQGLSGVSIISGVVNSSGQLLISYSNNTTGNAGNVFPSGWNNLATSNLNGLMSSGDKSKMTGLPDLFQRTKIVTNGLGQGSWQYPIPYASGVQPGFSIDVLDPNVSVLSSVRATVVNNTGISFVANTTAAVTLLGINVLTLGVLASTTVSVAVWSP